MKPQLRRFDPAIEDRAMTREIIDHVNDLKDQIALLNARVDALEGQRRWCEAVAFEPLTDAEIGALIEQHKNQLE